MAQLLKNPPAMWDTWVQSLGWEDPLEKGKATHSSILAPSLENSMDCIVHGVSESQIQLSNFHTSQSDLNTSSVTWRRQWHPTPVLLPGKSHGWRSLVDYSPWSC